jgi:copper chaperone
METANFRIEGMHCEGCAKRISQLLQRQQGVREAHVPFAGGGEASIRFNPHIVTRDHLVAVIEEAGFDVVESR